MAIEWNAATMSTGVDEIDMQHQELIARLNELFERMHRGEGVDALSGVLDFLGTYAAWHFGREERCMAAVRCPVAAANKQAHAAFIVTFDTLRKRFETEGPSTGLAIETQRELTAWLTTHIVRIDTKLKACVNAA